MVSAPVAYLAPDPILTADVLAHMEAQLNSARRLLGLVLEQGAAIRARDVTSVVRMAGELQVELGRRRVLDDERAVLLERAGARLDIAAGAVTLEAITALMDPRSAEVGRRRSAELLGMLHETQREHNCNRALMRQELAFLDHLLRLADLDTTPSYNGYGAVAATVHTRHSRTGTMRALDLQA